jgi:hypothetical protein
MGKGTDWATISRLGAKASWVTGVSEKVVISLQSWCHLDLHRHHSEGYEAIWSAHKAMPKSNTLTFKTYTTPTWYFTKRGGGSPPELYWEKGADPDGLQQGDREEGFTLDEIFTRQKMGQLSISWHEDAHMGQSARGGQQQGSGTAYGCQPLGWSWCSCVEGDPWCAREIGPRATRRVASSRAPVAVRQGPVESTVADQGQCLAAHGVGLSVKPVK